MSIITSLFNTQKNPNDFGKQNDIQRHMVATPWHARTSGGLWIGVDGSVTLYRKIPTYAYAWETLEVQMTKGGTLHQMLDELGRLSKTPSVGEFSSLAKNRKVHIVSHIRYVRPPYPEGSSPEHRAFLDELFYENNVVVPEQFTAIGVTLWPSQPVGKRRQQRNIVEQVRDYAAQYSTARLPNLELYEADQQIVNSALAHYGVETLSLDERLFMERWLSGGTTDEPIFVEEDDRIIVKDRNPEAYKNWERLSRLAAECEKEGNKDRGQALYMEAEAEILNGGNIIQFLAASESGMPDRIGQAPNAPFLMDAQQHPFAAICTSLRFELEPGSITRNRARKTQKHAYKQLEEEAQASEILSRVEQEDAFAGAKSVEDHYATSSEPSITKLSLLWAWEYADVDENFADSLRARYEIDATVLAKRQYDAAQETLPASPIMAAPDRPYSHDALLQTIAHSGLGSLSTIGDSIKKSEDPNQPLPVAVHTGISHPSGSIVWTNPWAASEQNASPTMCVIGRPGSGKLLTLSTPIPTPTGWTTMGELEVGDRVLGSDGSPCRVTHLSDIDESPELYDIHLSDGQVVRACKDHQWVVSTYRDRTRCRTPKRVASIDRYERLQRAMNRLLALADSYCDSDMLSAEEIFEHISDFESTWKDVGGVVAALDFVGLKPSFEPRHIVASHGRKELLKQDPVNLFNTEESLVALMSHWDVAEMTKRTKDFPSRKRAAEVLLAEGAPEEMTAPEITRLLADRGAVFSEGAGGNVRIQLRKAGVTERRGMATVRVPLPDSYTYTRPCRAWSAPLAFKALAYRIELMYGETPRTEEDSRVLTTAEMLTAGIASNDGRSEFAIALPEPLQLEERQLEVDPYVLGAWLGDGSTGNGTFTQGQSDACTDEAGLTDQAHLLAQLEAAGYEAHPIGNSGKTISALGLMAHLREIGVLRDKHIPTEYLRASEAQRLALLQGLMDTDGTVGKGGACELTLCNERLALDALELIRSLGIRSSIKFSPAAITEADPDNPGQKRRRITSTRGRMIFTTNRPVFRLPRKLARLPESVRQTQKWLYIKDIVPVASEPGRCITVDSPDHTYLVEGFVPTHNTFLIQHLCYQFALNNIPVYFVNPKGSDSLQDYAAFCGGETIRISDVATKPGAFDPFRFAEGREIVEIATDHISSSLNNRGDGLGMDEVIAISSALERAVSSGEVHSVGQAMYYLPEQYKYLAERVWNWARNNSNFALGVAFEPRGPIGAQRRFTLVEFDQEASLPERTNPNELTMGENSAIAGQRILWRAGIEIMKKAGGGVVAGDEAWTFLSSPHAASIIAGLNRKGRSMGIFLALMTQKIADVEMGDLEGYLSRVAVMAMDDRREIEAAMRLCRMEVTEELIEIIRTAGPVPPSAGDPSRGIPMTPARPATMIFRDMGGRHGVATVEPIVERYRKAFSTNRNDKIARAQQTAASPAGLIRPGWEI